MLAGLLAMPGFVEPDRRQARSNLTVVGVYPTTVKIFPTPSPNGANIVLHGAKTRSWPFRLRCVPAAEAVTVPVTVGGAVEFTSKRHQHALKAKWGFDHRTTALTG